MKTNKIIVLLVLLVISVMSIGYAIFATQLNINGKGKITGDWNVKITGIEAIEVSDGCSSGEPTFTDTTATFDASLEKPGDKVTYKITVQNLGTIDANLKNIAFTDDENGSSAIIHSNTNPSDVLNSGEETTFTVTVSYDEDYTEVPDIRTKDITGIIEYVQK